MLEGVGRCQEMFVDDVVGVGRQWSTLVGISRWWWMLVGVGWCWLLVDIGK